MSSRVPFRFHPAFRELPAQWLVLSYHKRSLLQDLWRLSADDCSGWIETARDPAQFLACSLDIRDRRDRQNAVRAIRELIADGFIEVSGERSRVHQTSIGRSTSCTPVVAPDVTPAESQPGEIIASASPRKRDQKEERERAREDFVPARRPVGEPPADFVERHQDEPALEDQILTAWKRAVFEKTTRTPASSKPALAGASEVAAWLRANVRENETPLGAFQVALKLYVAEDKKSLVDASWPLKWLTERLPGYLAAKQSAAKSSNPTHQVWKAPDYEAEMRASYDPERIRKEREEWFAQHPELRAEVEERERELQAEGPRVVVSITEAPKPPRAVRTAEDLEARKRFLQEQAKQLLAAKAAQ